MAIRGIRGATTVHADEPDLILQATRELLEEILAANEGMQPEDVASAIVFLIGNSFMTGCVIECDGVLRLVGQKL